MKPLFSRGPWGRGLNDPLKISFMPGFIFLDIWYINAVLFQGGEYCCYFLWLLIKLDSALVCLLNCQLFMVLLLWFN